MGSNQLWQNHMWLKDPEDLHQSQLRDDQNQPQDHQNHFQNVSNKQPPVGSGSNLFQIRSSQGRLLIGVVLEVILVVLGVVLVVLHWAQRQCSEQMFGTESVRNNVPSQHSLRKPYESLGQL